MIRKENCKKKLSHFSVCAVILSLLFTIFMAACSGVTYETFTSQEGDPPFSFRYPSNYYLVYEPPLPSDDVFVAIAKKSLFLPMIRIIGVRIDEWGSSDPKSILESHLQSMSTSQTISDFKILDKAVILVSGIEAQYAAYSYVETTFPGVGKYIVVNHNGFTWTIEAISLERNTGELDAVVERLLHTLSFLD